MREEELAIAIEIIYKEIYDEQPFEKFAQWARKTIGSPPWDWFVAEEGGKIVGVIGWKLWDVYHEKVILQQSWIAVSKSHQRQGLGTRLWKESLELARKDWQKEGREVVAIFVQTEEDNPGSIVFYEKIMHPDEKVILSDGWGKENGIVFYFKKLKEN